MAVTGEILRREEINIILDMDATYRSAWAEEARANDERAKAEAAARAELEKMKG